MALLSGDASDNTLTGSASSDTISGYGGDDVLRGDAGADLISAGDGADVVSGDDGADMIYGGVGDDLLAGAYPTDSARDQIYGDEGNDGILFDPNDRAYGGLGDDVFEVSPGSVGGSFATTLDGGDGTDLANLTPFTGPLTLYLNQYALAGWEIDNVELVLTGDGGATVVGSTQDEGVLGGAGADNIRAGDGADLIAGFEGADTLSGEGGDDVMDGGPDDDALYGGAGVDLVDYSAATNGVHVDLSVTSGQDTGFGRDTLSGVEQLYGTIYADTLHGAGAAESLTGSDGDDAVAGGAGDDILTGGGGADTFKYLAYADSPLASPDAIGDFQHGVDHIDISALHTQGSTFGLATANGATQVFIDQGGDGTNDALITLLNTTSVTTADFIW